MQGRSSDLGLHKTARLGELVGRVVPATAIILFFCCQGSMAGLQLI